jgi:hypothetical protein
MKFPLGLYYNPFLLPWQERIKPAPSKERGL